jgi:antitoxin component YwqK of YwqJK toxin-antitoxin module
MALKIRINKRTYMLLLTFLAGLVAFTVSGCTREVPKEQTYLRNGVLYEVGKNKPFSGYVVGKGREGYRAKRLRYRKKYKDGLRNGDTRFWYAHGQLESVEPYHNGKINGMVARYYENGQIKTYIHLVNGERGGYKGEMFWQKNGRK